MRCLSCNVILTDSEATRKYTSGGFIDLCNRCFSEVEDDIPHIEGIHDQDSDHLYDKDFEDDFSDAGESDNL